MALMQGHLRRALAGCCPEFSWEWRPGPEVVMLAKQAQ